MIELRCTTCNRNIVSDNDFVKFDCPSCLKAEIIRCKNCKNLSNEYVCPKCGFVGP